MIAKLSGRLAVLIATVVVLVVLLAGWFLLVSPEQTKASDLQTQVDKTQGQLADTEAYVRDPANRQSVREFRRLQRLLPDDVRMSEVLRQLSAASANTGVELDSIAPAAPLPANGGEATPITLSVVGHYQNIANFLHALRRRALLHGNSVSGAGRLYSVDGIQFTGGAATGSDTTAGSSSNLAATLALNVYSYGAGGVPPTTTTTTPTDTSTTAATTTTP